MGSTRSNAGVSGPAGKTPADGIESSFCKAAMARAGSPICDATRARISIGMGPVTKRSHGPFRQSQRGGFVARAHVGKREISNEQIIVRLFFEKRFQFAASLPPNFPGRRHHRRQRNSNDACDHAANFITPSFWCGVRNRPNQTARILGNVIAHNVKNAVGAWVTSQPSIPRHPVTSFPPYRCHCDRCESYRSEPRHII
jgi:hypothetical protein